VRVLRHFCSLLLLGLSVCPLTAPFQGTHPEHVTASILADQHDPGMDVAPLVTRRGRVTLAPSTILAVVTRLLPASSSSSGLLTLIAAARDTRRGPAATVLRV